MKRVLKIIVVSLVILFVLFYGIPQLVNHKAPCFGFEQGSIGTKDLLVYYGDVLCAVGAFVGIFFTAHFPNDSIAKMRSTEYVHICL